MFRGDPCPPSPIDTNGGGAESRDKFAPELSGRDCSACANCMSTEMEKDASVRSPTNTSEDVEFARWREKRDGAVEVSAVRARRGEVEVEVEVGVERQGGRRRGRAAEDRSQRFTWSTF